ncbi:MAG: hypothetical protein LZF60_360080 [Nitrospira sp.]|nr:MAG: hypothetical protein LZF60_360080 [Nitrospira sp.]
MGTLHELKPIGKTRSISPTRALISMLAWIEREWHRQPKTAAEAACLKDAHRGLAGLLVFQEDRAVKR